MSLFILIIIFTDRAPKKGYEYIFSTFVATKAL